MEHSKCQPFKVARSAKLETGSITFDSDCDIPQATQKLAKPNSEPRPLRFRTEIDNVTRRTLWLYFRGIQFGGNFGVRFRVLLAETFKRESYGWSECHRRHTGYCYNGGSVARTAEKGEVKVGEKQTRFRGAISSWNKLALKWKMSSYKLDLTWGDELKFVEFSSKYYLFILRVKVSQIFN